MRETTLKAVSAAAIAACGAYFHQLAVPLVLLTIVMVLDYLSGMTRAWIRRELSSGAGIIGIIKKLCYMMAVAVAVTVDLMLQVAAERAALDLTGCWFCALLVVIWLTMNECISILENISDIGVPVPAFLMAVVKRLKQSAEKKGGGDSDGKK